MRSDLRPGKEKRGVYHWAHRDGSAKTDPPFDLSKKGGKLNLTGK